MQERGKKKQHSNVGENGFEYFSVGIFCSISDVYYINRIVRTKKN